MKRDHSNPQPFLLPVSGADLKILENALQDYAVKSEIFGDSETAVRAVKIMRRARSTHNLAAIVALGAGLLRGRGQG